jgi:hypothetical protein
LFAVHIVDVQSTIWLLSGSRVVEVNPGEITEMGSWVMRTQCRTPNSRRVERRSSDFERPGPENGTRDFFRRDSDAPRLHHLNCPVKNSRRKGFASGLHRVGNTKNWWLLPRLFDEAKGGRLPLSLEGCRAAKSAWKALPALGSCWFSRRFMSTDANAITDERVAGAADRLIQEGRKVSPVAIWSELQGGSMVAIAAALDRWREARELQTAPLQASAALPENLAETLMGAASRIWASAHDEAQRVAAQRVDVVTRHLDVTLSERSEALTEYQKAVEEIRAERERLSCGRTC